jgi:hypothetical protein
LVVGALCKTKENGDKAVSRPSRLDEFAESIGFYEGDFDNEPEILEIYNSYQRQWSDLMAATGVLAVFGLQQPERFVIGLARRTARAARSALSWAKAKKIDALINSALDMDIHTAFKLRRMLMDSDELLNLFELNPSLVDTFSKLNNAGVSDALLGNGALLTKLNSLPCSIL